MDQVSTFGQGELKKGNGDSRRALKVSAGRVKICYEAPPSLSSTRSRQASTSNHRKVCVVDWDSLILPSDPNSPLAHGRPTNGGCTPDRVACLVPSQLVYPSASCALLGDLRSMSVLIELGIGWVWLRGNSSHAQRLLVALSKSRPGLP